MNGRRRQKGKKRKNRWRTGFCFFVFLFFLFFFSFFFFFFFFFLFSLLFFFFFASVFPPDLLPFRLFVHISFFFFDFLLPLLFLRCFLSLSLAHISSGDLLRDEAASGSAMGKELHKMMVEGILVPMETVLKLIQWSVLNISS